MRGRLAELGRGPVFGRELTGFSQDAEGVAAQVGNEILRARYLVGADGGMPQGTDQAAGITGRDQDCWRICRC